MIETEHVGMQTEAMKGIVAIAILNVATNGVPHIGSMNTYLILATCLELELHKGVSR